MTQHVATVGIDGHEARILRAPGRVSIVAASRFDLPLAGAVTLVGLLSRAIDSNETGVLGSVPTVDGRRLYVKRWPTCIGLSETETGHSGVVATLRDQATGLRDAVARAAGVDAAEQPQKQHHEPAVAAGAFEAKLPQQTSTPTHTRSNAPTSKRRHAV